MDYYKLKWMQIYQKGNFRGRPRRDILLMEAHWWTYSSKCQDSSATCAVCQGLPATCRRMQTPWRPQGLGEGLCIALRGLQELIGIFLRKFLARQSNIMQDSINNIFWDGLLDSLNSNILFCRFSKSKFFICWQTVSDRSNLITRMTADRAQTDPITIPHRSRSENNRPTNH